MKFRFIILLVFIFGIAMFSSSNMMVNSSSTNQSGGNTSISFGHPGASSSQKVEINSFCSGVSCPLPNSLS